MGTGVIGGGVNTTGIVSVSGGSAGKREDRVRGRQLSVVVIKVGTQIFSLVFSGL